MTRLSARSVVLAAVVCMLWSVPGQARRPKKIAFIPDASCRSDKLVPVIEQVLAEELHVKGIEIASRDKGSTDILLRYFMIRRRRDDKLTIELDGRVFGNKSGKLLAEGTATSDPQADDEGGRTAAVRQAAGKLAGDLSAALEKVLWARGKGRRVMLQVALDEKAAAQRDEIIGRLEKALSSSSYALKGSTERNLVVVFETSARTKDLVESLGKVLGGGSLKVSWMMKSENTLLANLGGS